MRLCLMLMIEGCPTNFPGFIFLPFSSYPFEIGKINQPCQKLYAEARHTGICYHQLRVWPWGSPCASSADSLSGLWPGLLLHSDPQHEVLGCACTSYDKNCGRSLISVIAREGGVRVICILLSWLSTRYSDAHVLFVQKRNMTVDWWN